jgi:hypothetical protein
MKYRSRRRIRKKNITRKHKGGVEYQYANDMDRFTFNLGITRKNENSSMDVIEIIDRKYNKRIDIGKSSLSSSFNIINDPEIPYFTILDGSTYYPYNKNFNTVPKDSKEDKYILSIITQEVQKGTSIYPEYKRTGVFKLMIKNEYGCFTQDNPIDIEKAIEQLNIRLQKKCNKLKVVMAYYYDLTGKKVVLSPMNELVICLYDDSDRCISNIMLSYKMNKDKGIITIESMTDVEYEGRKYNKLLRAIAIKICSILRCNNKTIDYIYSYAVSPISSWLLIDNFIVEIDDTDFNNIKTKGKNNTMKLIEKKSPIRILVPINKENVATADRLIDDLLEPSKVGIKC